MNGYEIEKIIKKIKDNPYKCIMISGAWGIGKTYSVVNSLDDNSCIISLFDISEISDIYSKLFYEIIFNKDNKIFSKVVDGIADIFEKAIQKASNVDLGQVFSKIITKQDLVLYKLEKLNDKYIIVFDDLERLPDSVELKSVLGVIEKLKEYDKVIIVIISNVNEIKNKDVLKSYSEKVIERVYEINELDAHINWISLGIEPKFASDILENHKIKNLRTLKKAQQFYEDVRLSGGIEDENFLDCIKHICFAIVIESEEKLYEDEERDKSKKEKDVIQQTTNVILAKLIHRISIKYLTNIWHENGILEMILKYYQSVNIFDSELYALAYEAFCNADEIGLFYKDEVDVRNYLNDWKNNLKQKTSITELRQLAEDYLRWMQILKMPIVELVSVYKEQAYMILWKNVTKYGREPIHLDDLGSYWECKELTEASKAVLYEIREKQVIQWINSLAISMDGKEAYDISYKLRQCYDNSYYDKIVKKNCELLLDRWAFPIDNMNEEKYYACFNIMYILNKEMSGRLEEYLDELVKTVDVIAAYRIRRIYEELIRGF